MKPELERGSCLIFAWGPPWNWLPRISKSKYGMGCALIWLWWGIYYVPRSFAWLVVGAGMYWLKPDEIRAPQSTDQEKGHG